MKKLKNDQEKFREIQTHARDLKNIHAKRDAEFDEYERMYLLDWNPEGSRFEAQDMTKNTPSPSARNKVLNACRLLMSQEPVFDIRSDNYDETKTEIVEKSISRWWEQAGRANRRPIHYDMILSACLYDEMHTAITVMDDYKVYNKEDKRAERISKITPILFQSWNPRNGYPEFDELGLCGYYREVQVRWSYIAQKYKDLLADKYTWFNRKSTENVQLKMFYDLTHYAIWINDEEPFVCEEHGLPCIPIDVTLANGSQFFEREEDRRQPLLFSIMRSKLWKRESLLYTVLYSLLFTLGVTPTYVFKTDTEDNLDIRNDGAINYVMMRKGDTIDTLDSKGILPPEVQKLSEMTSDLIDGSTIYNTAFGEKNFNSQTFSETSLLQQAGRLPLIGPQRLGGFGISSAVEMALMMMKEKGLSFQKNGINIKASEIPEDIEVKAKLDVILPQEKLQMVNIGLQMQKLGMPDEYIQSNLLGITNTKEIKNAYVQQQAENNLIQYKIQQKLQQIQTQDQQREQQKQQQIQQAVQQTQQQLQQQPAQSIPSGQPEQPEQPQGLTQGQQLEAAMLQGAKDYNRNPQQYEQMMGSSMPMMMEGQSTQGGLPPEMMGMIPGGGVNGMPGETDEEQEMMP